MGTLAPIAYALKSIMVDWQFAVYCGWLYMLDGSVSNHSTHTIVWKWIALVHGYECIHYATAIIIRDVWAEINIDIVQPDQHK